MKGIQSKFNIITIITAIAYILVMLWMNVGYLALPVATVPGSYADQYAKDHYLPNKEIAASDQIYLDLRYEHFDYNTNDDDGLTIEGYQGESQKVVVPYVIDGKMVTRIGENFFAGNPAVKEVYLPVTVNAIEGEVAKDVTIYTDKDSSVYKENAEKSDATWNVEALFDSDYINYFNSEIPFSYNINGSEVELTGYTGDEKLIVIPSYIDGKPVTTVSFDMLGSFTGVVFPETVTSITGQVGKVIYTLTFAIELIFSVIAFLIVLIFVNIALPKLKKIEEIQLTSPEIICCFIYLIGQLVFSVVEIQKNIVSAPLALVISLVWMILNLAFILMAKTGRTYQKEVETRIEEKTSNMKSIKKEMLGLSDDIKNAEVRKQVERAMEAVKYLPVGSGNLAFEDKLTEAISELKVAIDEKKDEDILKKCKVLIGICERK